MHSGLQLEFVIFAWVLKQKQGAQILSNYGFFCAGRFCLFSLVILTILL